MIRLEQSNVLKYEKYVRFENSDGVYDLHLKGSLYHASHDYKPFQLVLTYDNLWLRCKYFNSEKEALEYLERNEFALKDLAEAIRKEVFSYEYDLVEKYKIIDERGM